ncbi:MAG: hypothetical protein WA874_02390 [Chryseosolibacter sp.]
MNHPGILIVLVLLALTTLSACNDDEDESPLLINKLEASAGTDQLVQVSTLVTLDGTASADGNGKPFAFQWTFKNKPTQSSAVLENSSTATPSFTPDLVGLYTVEVKITQGDFSKTDFVMITVTAGPAPQAHILNENITADQHLENLFEDPVKPDYVVTSDLVVTAQLTIAPGVVIEFDSDKSLQIYPGGTLIAKGTSTENIVFTGKGKVKGYWKGILFLSNDVENELDHVSVASAGSNALPEVGVKASVALAGTESTGSALKISNSNLYDGNGYGLYVAGQSQLNYFYANYFTNNTASALYVPAGQLHNLDFFSHYTGNNGYDGIETGGSVKANSEVNWTYFNDGSRYLVTSDLIIESGVRVSEGATFEFARDIALSVVGEGYMMVTGTDFKPVTFTAKVKTAGNFWKGIAFDSGHELNSLEHTIISHAGYSSMSETDQKANLTVTAAGKINMNNSRVEKGLGWGLVVAEGAQINTGITTSNTFSELAAGKYKLPFSGTITASLAGDWVDERSHNNKHYSINTNFYNKTSETWFEGATDPWNMEPRTGFGLKIDADGSYVWTIAEHSPVTGCVSYSAEYIIGKLLASGHELSFQESFWRSKFYNACDAEQDVDINIEPGGMVLRYELDKTYDMFTGEAFWRLKIINADNSSFSYYKRE